MHSRCEQVKLRLHETSNEDLMHFTSDVRKMFYEGKLSVLVWATVTCVRTKMSPVYGQ